MVEIDINNIDPLDPRLGGDGLEGDDTERVVQKVTIGTGTKQIVPQRVGTVINEEIQIGSKGDNNKSTKE